MLLYSTSYCRIEEQLYMTCRWTLFWLVVPEPIVELETACVCITASVLYFFLYMHAEENVSL